MGTLQNDAEAPLPASPLHTQVFSEGVSRLAPCRWDSDPERHVGLVAAGQEPSADSSSWVLSEQPPCEGARAALGESGYVGLTGI